MKKTLFLLFFMFLGQAQAARLFVKTNSDVIAFSGPSVATNALTLSVWVMPASQPATNAEWEFWTNTSGANRPGWCMNYHDTAGTPGLRFFWAATFAIFNIYNVTATLSSNTWYHIAWTVDSGQPKCYINGTAQTVVGAGTGISTTFGGSGRIGAMYWDTDLSFFDGRVDEPAVWHATLNQREITALSNGVRANRIQYDNLDRYYSDLGLESTERDRSANRSNTTSITGTSRVNGPPVIPRQ